MASSYRLTLENYLKDQVIVSDSLIDIEWLPQSVTYGSKSKLKLPFCLAKFPILLKSALRMTLFYSLS